MQEIQADLSQIEEDSVAVGVTLIQQNQAAICEGLDLPRRVAMECRIEAMNSRAHSRRCR